MPVKPGRIHERIEALSKIGGTPDGGVTRLPFSREEAHANELVEGWMKEAGLAVRRDAAGNLIGRQPGPPGPALALGSHLDSVVNGGRFDGVVGVVLALEVAQALTEDGVTLGRPLEIISFLGEEGSRFPYLLLGSTAMVGGLPEEAAETLKDSDGISLAQAMRSAGLDPAAIQEATRRPGELAAYLEVHIEQGNVLESHHLPVGVVTGIAGPRSFQVTLRGRADHAGATPMPLRKDPAPVAAAGILAAEELAKGSPTGTTVATVGRLQMRPGVPNVIPEEVLMTFDVRDIDEGARDSVAEGIIRAVEKAAQVRGVTTSWVEQKRESPVQTAPILRQALSQTIEALGLQPLELPSGAVHDAMMVARLCPIGMLFVRSVHGISHSPEEYTRPQDIEIAARVFYQAVHRLG